MSIIDNDTSNENINDDLPQVDELATLKSRADMMGVSYHPSIKLEKLRDKVNEAMTAEVVTEKAIMKEARAVAVEAKEETLGQRRSRKKREANELVRVRVSCMNPAKKEWEGEIFTAGNSLVGSFTKYVPFNTEDGWHVPRIILNQIQQRQAQIFVAVKDARGNTGRKGKLIKEFAVEILDPLTLQELQELAQRQAMAKSID